MTPRILLLGGVLLATAACATSEEWSEWRAHPSHFASKEHWRFSMQNRFAPPLLQSPEDVELASAQGWWGGPFAAPPLADVAGAWRGTWTGVDVNHWVYRSLAQAQFDQWGRYGEGRLALADTLTMDVPTVVMEAGMHGVRVVLEVSGSRLVIRHKVDGRYLTGEFTVDGDRMVGRLNGSSARLVLVRQR